MPVEHITLASEDKVSLVGRQRELGLLLQHLEMARAGQGSVVLIGGEPGIGKTRLTQELAERAEIWGVRVLGGRCWDADIGAPAFWPWTEALSDSVHILDSVALRSALRGSAADVVQLLVPEILAVLPDMSALTPIEPELARFRLFRAVTAFLRRLTSSPDLMATEVEEQALELHATLPISYTRRPIPLLLVLDDLHWADKSSLLLLQFLAREIANMPLLVVGNYRDTELDQTHALTTTLAALRREPTCERIGLRGLAEHDVQTLIEERITPYLGPLGQKLTSILCRETEGNPLFVGETLSHLIESGWLQQQDGHWVLKTQDISERGIPASVTEVIGRRLSRLSGETQRILGVAAVIGRDFDAALLEAALGQDAEHLDRALEEAQLTAVINAVGRGEHYRFGHALLRETLYAGLATRRRVRLHRQLGEALEARYGGTTDRGAAELAYHFLKAGVTAKALRYSWLAGERSEAASAWEEASHHYEQCLVLLSESNVSGAPDGAALLVAIGRCYRNANDYRGAWRSFLRAISQYQQRGDGIGVARATLEALRIAAPPERRDALVQEALAALGGRDPHLEARLLLHRTVWTRREDGGGENQRRATELAEQHGLEVVEPVLANTEGNRALLNGRPDEARRIFEGLYESTARQGKHGWALHFLVSANTVPLFAGALGEGETGTRRAIAYARDTHNRLREAGLLTWLAGTALARGEHTRYAAFLEQAAVANPTNFSGDWLRAVCSEIAGDIAQATAVMPGPERTGGFPTWVAVVHGGWARLRFHGGDLAAAQRDLALWEEHWAPFRITDGTSGYLHTLICVDDVLPALGRVELVESVYAELQQWSWAHFAPANACGIDQLRGALALRLGDTAAAESHYATGLVWATHEACSVEAGRCLLGLAEVAAQRAQFSEALRMLERATAVFQVQGAYLYLRQVSARKEEISSRSNKKPHAATRPLTATATLPDGLSEREVEILRLVAQGKTNQEIAAHLSISASTVARHVTHIFMKTGASNRTEAAIYGHHHLLV